MIGIIGAMEEEVAGLKAKMTGAADAPGGETAGEAGNPGIRTETRAGMTFYQGKLAGRDVVVVCSGIGKVNAAACAQILADRYQVSMIMNTGIAGGLLDEVNVGDIVLSEDAVQHDMDCVGFGYDPGVIPRMETSFFKADPKLVELAEQCCREVNPEIQVFRGRVASGDCFVSSAEKKAAIRSGFQAACCEMEGAAIAHVAWLNGLPWIIIRAISDKADGTAAEQYDKFQDAAIEHFLRLTLAMVSRL